MTSSEPSPEAPPVFSVFRALRVERHEVRHSNFLAWLINPQESHLQGTLFLRLFLDVVARAIGEKKSVAATLRAPETTTGAVEVRREADRLDLRIVIPEIKVVVAIENKVFASEQSGQLSRYADSVLTEYANWDSVLLYLTLDGDSPSDDRWLPITHRHVLEMITKGIEHLSSETPAAVRTFIEHYAELLRDIYSSRPVIPRTRRIVEVLEPLRDAANVGSQEKPPGFDKFEALLKKLVQVPKAEVVKLMAEEKAARMEHRRQKQRKLGS